MSNEVKIEQIDLPYASKLDATVKVTKTLEVSQQVTFLGVVNQIAAVVKQVREFEAQKQELIDLCASIAAAQTYTDEEIAQVQGMVMLDEETKKQLIAEITELAFAKMDDGSVQVVGKIDQTSIVPEKVEMEPAAPVDETPVTQE